MSSAGYREGDYYVQCDRTGRKILRSETVREWTGAIVDRRYAVDLHRHPQEIQRVIGEKLSVANPRPQAVATFIGPLQTYTTVAALAGAVIMAVYSSVRFAAGDSIGIMLSSGDLHRNTVADIGDGTHIQVATPLPRPVDAGATVVDYTALATSDIV